MPFWSGFEMTLTHPTDTSHNKNLHITLPTLNSHPPNAMHLNTLSIVFKTLRTLPSTETAKRN